MAPPGIQHEIFKKNPFSLAEEEAFLNIIRTASQFNSEFERLFKQHQLSEATYNVLRILRGAGTDGRMCHEIGTHMVTQVPDVTRLVDRLEALGLASRCRCERDRRVVWVRITPAGEQVLRSLDEPVAALHKRQLGHMPPEQLRALNELLVRCRQPRAGESN